MKKPHIIIFNPDQMRSDSLGHLGNPCARTPFLDGFARTEGVSFSNTYCQNTVCVPSRASFTTGLYPHVNGHRTMNYLLREGEETIFKELKDQGYHVWMNARNDLIAGQIEGLLEKHASEIYYGGNSKTPPGPVSLGLKSKSDHIDYSMYNGELGVDEDGLNYGADDEDLDAAIKKIRSYDDEQPLCLFLGLINPHPPYQVEEPYFSSIKREDLTPRIKSEDGTDKAYMMDLIRKNQKLDTFTEDDWNEMRACYLGMCMKVDQMFKKLCDALKEAGIYDDSAIFFLSDHGDYTGDYGISEKSQNTFEDCLTNVPFLIKPPGWEKNDPGISESMVELVDFYGTVIDYANISSTHTHFGRSLKNIIGDRSLSNREYVCCEGGRLEEEIHCDEFHANGPNGTTPYNPYYPRHLAQSNTVAHGKATMIRTKRYKYIARLYGKDEFYDLEKDPKELHNVIDINEYREEILNHKEMLMRWYLNTSDIVPFDYDMRFSPEMTWQKIKRLVPKEYEEEIKTKIAKGVNPFVLMNECRKRFGSEN
jgi:arylsulfatase A-like enzyme